MTMHKTRNKIRLLYIKATSSDRLETILSAQIIDEHMTLENNKSLKITSISITASNNTMITY